MKKRYGTYRLPTLVFFVVLLLAPSFSFVSSAMTASTLLSSSPSENDHLQIKDIRFGIGRIATVVENTGKTDISATVSFSVSKGVILPVIIGTYDVTIPAEGTRIVFQSFSGFGIYTVHSRFDSGQTAGSLVTRGLWLSIFGIEFL